MAQSLSGVLGQGFSRPVTVHIAPDRKLFREWQPAGARVPSWAAGVAFPGRDRIILQTGSGIDLERTFWHEATHLLLAQAFGHGRPVPHWLDEGLAVLLAGQWSMQRLSTMTFAVLSDSLLPLDEITASFPTDLRQAEIAYCQSYYFISFLLGEFGRPVFHKFLQHYARSGDFRVALRQSYDLTWPQVQQRWRQYLRLRFSWVPLLTSSGMLWFAASLVFIWGYLRKRARARALLRQWEAQESCRCGPDAG